MINRVVLIGRLTGDVNLKYTQSGIAVGTFTMAVNRRFSKKDSQEQEADFINCVIWRKSAENFSNFTGKGAPVAVEGRLQTRNYENKEGKRVYVTEVVVDDFSLIESKNEAEKRRGSNLASGSQQSQQSAQQESFNPFSGSSFDSGADISDEDLPF